MNIRKIYKLFIMAVTITAFSCAPIFSQSNKVALAEEAHNHTTSIKTEYRLVSQSTGTLKTFVYAEYTVTYCTSCNEVISDTFIKNHTCIETEQLDRIGNSCTYNVTKIRSDFLNDLIVDRIPDGQRVVHGTTSTKTETRREGNYINQYSVTYCTDCNEKISEQLVNSMEDNVTTDTIKDVENPAELISGNGIVEIDNQSETAEQLSKIVESDSETAVEIINTINQSSIELSAMLSSGDISQEKYEEMKDSLQAITETSIEIASSKDDAVENINAKVAEIGLADAQTSAPVVDLGDEISSFYQRQLDTILGKQVDNSLQPRNIASQGGNQESTLDLNISGDTYRSAIDFIDYSVDCMTKAVTIIRECSNEKEIQHINQIVTGISYKLFKDFDKEEADAQFLKDVSQAILLHLQQTVLASLDEAYEQAKSQTNYYGNTKKQIDEEYEQNKADVSDLEIFEAYVIETMRQKFVYILNNRLSQDASYTATYNSLMANATDWETFEPTYRDIFAIWALNKENKPEYEGITMEVLSNTIVNEKTANMTYTYTTPTSLTDVDVAFFATIGGLTILGIGFYIAYKCTKRKENK